MLDRTVVTSGRLSFEAPDTFVRETLKPSRDRLAVTGNTLTMSRGDRSRTVQLDAAPEAAVIVEAIRGTLTGNRAALERLFTPTVGGSAERWTLDLVPREARLRNQVAALRVSGAQAVVREVAVTMADGDRSVMTIEPMSATPPARAPTPAACRRARPARRPDRPTRDAADAIGRPLGAAAPVAARALDLARVRRRRGADHRAQPLRRRPVGLPAVGADRRAGGAARPGPQRRRRPPAADRHRGRRRRRARRRVAAARRRDARERPLRGGPQRRQQRVRGERPVPVRAPLPAEPGGRCRRASRSTACAPRSTTRSRCSARRPAR